jgi:Holliday junction resolvase RusA-like endonuclease
VTFGLDAPVSFVVYGQPQQAGSKRHVGRGRIIDDNPRAAEWKRDIAQVAGQSADDLFEGAVRLSARFFLPRPGGHFGTGRNAGHLRPSAPTWPATRPDVDKLARAVLDGVVGILLRDDAQVVQLEASKHYGEPVRLEVEVGPAFPFELARTG